MRDSSTSSPMAIPSLSNISFGRSKAAVSPTAVIRSRDIVIPLLGVIVREPYEKARDFWKPNARGEPRPMAGATQERKLLAVACRPMLGASAAAPPHMWKEQGQRRALCAILPWTPWVVVTVPALVPCARL